jgi:hypothetical protein
MRTDSHFLFRRGYATNSTLARWDCARGWEASRSSDSLVLGPAFLAGPFSWAATGVKDSNFQLLGAPERKAPRGAGLGEPSGKSGGRHPPPDETRTT